jgi:hypothetical protein
MGCPIKTLQNPGGEKIYDENIIEEAVTFLKNEYKISRGNTCRILVLLTTDLKTSDHSRTPRKNDATSGNGVKPVPHDD